MEQKTQSICSEEPMESSSFPCEWRLQPDPISGIGGLNSRMQPLHPFPSQKKQEQGFAVHLLCSEGEGP